MFAEDIWGAPRRASYAAFKEDAQALGYAPGHGVDLIGAWKFEETAGDAVGDTSGYLKNGRLYGAVRTAEGKFGNALRFSGGSDRVKLGEPDRAGDWTASLWVNRAQASTGPEVLLDSPDYRISLSQGDGHNIGIADKKTGSHYDFNAQAPIGEWCSLTLVGTPSQTKLYLDGVLTDTVAAGIACPLDTIGAGESSLNGILDEVRVYGRALDENAIRSAMDRLCLFMPFEDSDDTVALDASGMDYNGVIKAPTVRVDNGKSGKGIRLSNRNSEIVLCHDDINGPWTVSLWVNRDEATAGGPLLRSYLGAISITQRKPKLTVHGGADYPFTTVIPGNAWTNLTFTSDGTGTSLYVDGIWKETINHTIPLPLMTLGYWWQAFDGRVDELRAYDRMLSGEEIAALVGCSPVAERVTNASVALSWNPVGDAVGYHVYRAEGEAADYVQLNETPLSVRRFTDRDVLEQENYRYAVGVLKPDGTTSVSVGIAVSIPEEYLVSEGKTATAGYSDGSHGPELAIDPDVSTYWDGGAAPQWWKIDLHEQHPLTRLVLRNYDDGTRYYNYVIEASGDNVNWTPVAEKTDASPATAEGDTYPVNVTARYLRVTTTQGSAGNFVHIRDFKAYGKEAGENITQGKPVTVSARADTAQKLNDSDAESFWDGGGTPQWAVIDLQNEYDIHRVLLKNYYGPLGARAYTYRIEGSLNNRDWFPIAEKTSGADSTPQGDSYDVSATARFLRATITGNNSSWGSYAHISDFRAYGEKRENLALSKPVEATGGSATAFKANDGSAVTFWDGGETPQSLTVDLLSGFRLDSILLKNYYGSLGERCYTYTIEGSMDKVNWSTIVEKSDTAPSTAWGDRYEVDAEARYLRITVLHNDSTWGSYAHISDIRATGQALY